MPAAGACTVFDPGGRKPPRNTLCVQRFSGATPEGPRYLLLATGIRQTGGRRDAAVELLRQDAEQPPQWAEPYSWSRSRVFPLLENRSSTQFEFLDLMARTHVSVVYPDVGGVGGLAKTMRVRLLAAQCQLKAGPHLWKTGISVAAATHVPVVTPHCPRVSA